MKGLEDTKEGFVGAKRNGLVIMHDQYHLFHSVFTVLYCYIVFVFYSDREI